MYYNHDLRSNLQEWMARLDRAEYDQFPNQLQSLLSNIKNNRILMGLIGEAMAAYPLSPSDIHDRLEAHNSDRLVPPLDDRESVSYCWHVVDALITEHGIMGFRDIYCFVRGNDLMSGKTDNLVRPIVRYLHDRLDKSSSVLFLLEKYKRRTEWFTRIALREKYIMATNQGYEKILDEDLRLFLFDQGVDYPFSAPNSPAGRVDIVGSIDTNDPLVVEVKILDKNRKYGKERIQKGFNQVLKYANDYSKDSGYLVIFNLDNTEIRFHFEQSTASFPPMFVWNQKRFYFIVVNLADVSGVSSQVKPKVIEVAQSDLLVSEE